MTQSEKYHTSVIVKERNTISLSKNRQLAKKIDKNRDVNQKRGESESV